MSVQVAVDICIVMLVVIPSDSSRTFGRVAVTSIMAGSVTGTTVRLAVTVAVPVIDAAKRISVVRDPVTVAVPVTLATKVISVVRSPATVPDPVTEATSVISVVRIAETVPGVVAFADPVGFGVRADPNDATGVDLDNDGQVDLGTANTDDGPTGGSVTALLDAIVPCPSDADGDGTTNVLDLIDVLLCFGLPALPPCDTGQDVNQDGVINVLDLIELLLAFGQACP